MYYNKLYLINTVLKMLKISKIRNMKNENENENLPLITLLKTTF